MPVPRKIHVIDSHTAGEPTRVIVDGGPDLGPGSLRERREVFLSRFDRFRSAVVGEPRTSDTVVGALVCPPQDPACAAGVIFFNNVGYLNMCGHGTIGLVTTLAHTGRLQPGRHKIETPVGVVTAELHTNGDVAVTNVPSYRFRKDVTVEVDGIGRITGDVAWGGNWFFLIGEHGQALRRENVDRLTDFTWRIREALARDGVAAADGTEIDHIELFGPPERPGADSRNFVLCPGRAYDRSPCGTGTSAKLACLFEDGKLREKQVWTQESIVGSVFRCWVDVVGGRLLPTICGSAFVNAESTLILDERDPFCWGIPTS